MGPELEAVFAERRALLVDDDPEVTHALEAMLELEGWSVKVGQSAPEAYRTLPLFQPDLVLLDLNLADESGLDVLEQIKAFDSSIAVVMISGYGTIEAAVEALKRGATSFLPKPFDASQLRLVLAQVNEALAAQKQLEALRRSRSGRSGIYGISPAARHIANTIDAISNAPSAVLIEGESGTGKRLIARAIHDQSAREKHGFVELSCSGLSGPVLEAELFGYERGINGAASSKAGLLEVADRGTLYLRQIGELPLALQSRLVSVIDEKMFHRVGGVRSIGSDFRLIASSRSDLSAQVDAGTFRDDLLYRLNVVHIQVPPLRERPEDIPLLVVALLERLAGELGFSNPRVTPAALEALSTHTWPGNIRELKNILERALLFSEGAPITTELLRINEGRNNRPRGSHGKVIRPLDEVVTDYVQKAVELTGGNVREAARKLRISPSTLYARLKEQKRV